ncbi:MAG: CPBP family intramembrane metalloprotease [Caldilineaceae bacterium]|nr:CPBP family intramembrane metalloprotease [Caldilineaceae bacterium]
MSQIVWLFWNRKQGRLRSGWRVAVHFSLWIILPSIIGGIFGTPLAQWIMRQAPGLTPIAERAVGNGLTLVSALLGTWMATFFLDHRPFADLGLRFNRDWWVDFLFGLTLGGVLISGIFLVELALGWVEVTGLFQVAQPGVPFALAMLGPIIVFIVIGITEELLARGYEIRNLAEGFNLPLWGPGGAVVVAWVVSSSLFGLLHVFNPNATWHSTLYLMVAGLFLGIGYILTGTLAIPIGLHITWNFVQGNIFGFPVSGNDFTTQATVIAIHQEGPALWTGGAFGPEAGLIGLAAMLIGSVLTMAWVYHRYGNVALDQRLAVYRRPDN